MRSCLSLLLAVVTSAAFAYAGDWPCWRGPAHSAISSEKGLLKNWPKEGPKLLWKTNKAALGYAGIAVVGGTVFTMGARGDEEFLIAFDSTGKELYSTKIGPVHDWDANAWSRGPNATPTVDNGLVYALSSKGSLLCAEAKTGTAKWNLDLAKEFSSEVNGVGGGIAKLGWGYSWSPVVDGDRLILSVGGPKGLIAALDKATGKLIWQSKSVTDQATYGTLAIATLGGVKQYIYVTQKGVVGIAAKDGAELWYWKREEAEFPDVVCATPLVLGDKVYISVGNGGGSLLLDVKAAGGKFTATEAYEEGNTKGLMNRQGGVVLLDKHIYGYNEDKAWTCIDFATGKTLWPLKRTKQTFKAGGFVVAEDRIYTIDEDGLVGMIEVSPKGPKIVGQFKLPEESKSRKPSGKVWTHPSLSDGKMYLRDQEWIFCYEVK